ncbi:phosphoglycerate kinase [Tepidicaulis marinus]|uniref:Phosphoglycerate kinase n=1 Tax=Tepidicaulis marinus TaxID=1333998 RepID=A0A081BEV7_9HYPH|nr:phosphoglycerate kinase [Tepidicaulis marinus]GAK46575.1 phosphoglycerate kinase [Tepidicaulis marinus]
MAAHKTLDDLYASGPVEGKTILLRADLNVPAKDGKVTDATRLERLLPTIKELASKGAKVLILSHFGRPKGERVPEMTLAPVAVALGELLGLDVAFAVDCIGDSAKAAAEALPKGGVLVLENTRYHAGEEKNDPAFAKALAELGDIYVNDAFSAAHRAHASTEGIAHLLPSYAGRAMEAELTALDKALGNPARPVVAIVGGAKISTKLDLLGNLVSKVDALIIGGGMANTFLAAKGIEVGKSLCEHDLKETAREIMAKAEAAGCRVVLPADVVVAPEFKAHAPATTVPVDKVPADQMILDIGPDSLAALAGHFETAKTVVWNGPFGAFEIPPFDNGTNGAARHVAMLTKMGEMISVAGGGDTVAALNNAGAADDFSYVSTAGGAFLEWLEGKTLPGVAALEHA